MRKDLGIHYEFANPLSQLNLVPELTSLGFCEFVNWMINSKKMHALDIGNYNSYSNDFRCGYFMLNSADLVSMTELFNLNGPDFLETFLEDRLLHFPIQLQDNAVKAVRFYEYQLWNTLVLGYQIAQSLPDANPSQLCRELDVKLRVDNPFITMVRELQQYKIESAVVLAHLSLCPDGLELIPEMLVTLFDLFRAPINNKLFKDNTMNEIPRLDWIQI